MSRPGRLMIGGLCLWLAACATPADTATPQLRTSGTGCDSLENIPREAFLCLDAPPNGMLVQSLEDQATIRLNDANITLDGTLYIDIVPGSKMTVATLEGVGIVGALGTARIVQPGAQVSVPLSGAQVSDQPGTPVPFDSAQIAAAPLETLTRSIQLPAPIAPPPGYIPPTSLPGTDDQTLAVPFTATRTPATESTEEAECIVREDWTGTHTIRRGETLSRIAAQYDVSLSELQEGNCLEDPDRIFSGQVLHLPPGAVTAIPGGPTFTPSAVLFRADQMSIQSGQCTTLRWDMDNVSSVSFEGEATDGHNARQVCPAASTTYTLNVVYPDGTQSDHNVTVTVTGN